MSAAPKPDLTGPEMPSGSSCVWQAVGHSLSYSCVSLRTRTGLDSSLYSHRTWRLTKALWKGGKVAILTRGQERHLVAFEILAVNTGSRLY